MSEVIVFHKSGERVMVVDPIETSRLLLVGCVDLQWGNDDSEYPLPVFLFDDDDPYVEITIADQPVRRVNGLRPDSNDYAGGSLETGSWDAMIDLPGEASFGKGQVKAKKGSVDAHIFEQPLPYLLDHKLSYVREADDQPVIIEEIINDEIYKLVYAPATVLEKLGRLATH